MIIKDLIVNTSFLIVSTYLYGLTLKKLQSSPVKQKIVTGILFGLVSILSMVFSFEMNSGLIFDGRSIILSLSGIFGGVLGALISAFFALMYRFFLGGVGLVSGVLVILTASASGVICYFLLKPNKTKLKLYQVYIYGLILHTIVIALFYFTLPGEHAIIAVRNTWKPFILFFPIVTLFIYYIFTDQEKRTREEIDFIKAQKEKEKANRNYQQLIEELHEGVGIVNLKEQFIYVNPAFEKMMGYKSDFLIGKNLSAFIPNDDFQNIILETEMRKEGNASNYNTKLLTNNGTLKTINVSTNPWRNDLGEIIGTMALIMDVTEQLKANDELNRRYNFEKRIFNISSRFSDTSNFDEKVTQSLNDIGLLCGAESVYVAKFENNNSQFKFEFIWENPTIEKIQTFDINPPSIFASEISKLSKNDHFYIKSISELPLELEPFQQYFIKNGIENLMGFFIYIGTKLYGFLGIQNIIKDRNWSKNEFILMRSAGEILCNSIQRKLNEDQIKELNTRLNEKNKEIEHVLYVTSHDIRSPLVNIIGFTQELNKSVDELIDFLNKEPITEEDRVSINYLIHEDIPEVLKFINSGGVKIDKLLNSLLHLSRLGRTPLELNLVNTDTLVREILASMEFQIQTYKIDVTISDLPEILTDKNLITQILTNLIDNAIKYHDKNKQSRLYIGSITNENEILFIVEDNGMGIPEDKRERVFEIFNRLNPEKTEGEGIGLTIIKKALERLNGKINLESGDGIGCKFIIAFNKN